MARLPAPILDEVKIEPTEDILEREKNFYSILGQVVRIVEIKKIKKEGEKGE